MVLGMDTNATNDIAENYSGNPPVIEKPIGTIAETIHQRILAEQQKLHVEEKSERDLTTKRIALLTEGSDADVDTCELAIDLSRTAQLRSLERIELLAEQLKQANQVAENQRLDDITKSAERARERGEKIIANVYPKLAKQLCAALSELAECESTIESANGQLRAGGRFAIRFADSERMSTAPFQNSLKPLHISVVLPSERGDGVAYWSETQTHETARKKVAEQGFALAQMQALRAKYGSKWRDTDEGRELLGTPA